MNPTIRLLLAVLAGLAVAMIAITGIEYASHLIYPTPPGLDPRNRADMASIVAALPAGALVLLLTAWGVGTFFGGWTAGRIARERARTAAAIIMLAILGGAVWNMATLPHPAWFWLAGPLVILLGGYAAMLMGRTRAGATPA